MFRIYLSPDEGVGGGADLGAGGQGYPIGSDILPSGGETPVGDTPKGGQPAPDFTPEGWELKYKGQSSYPKDRQHLVDLAQKGLGYERAMEDLNKQRGELDQLGLKYKQYDELNQRYESDPAFKQRFDGAFYGSNGESQEYAGEDNALMNEMSQLKQTIGELTQWRDQSIQDQADRSLNDEMDKIRQHPTFSTYDWQTDDGNGTLDKRVMKYAMDRKIGNMEDALKSYMFDQHMANTKLDAAKSVKEQQQKRNKAGIVENGQVVPKASQPYDNKNMNYSQLAQIAKKDLVGG